MAHINSSCACLSAGYGGRNADKDISSPCFLEYHHQDGHHDHHNEEDGREDSHYVVGVVGGEG